MDITNEEQVQKTFTTVADEFGRIDILVNNAGVIYKALYGTRETVDILTSHIFAISFRVVICVTAYEVLSKDTRPVFVVKL